MTRMRKEKIALYDEIYKIQNINKDTTKKKVT